MIPIVPDVYVAEFADLATSLGAVDSIKGFKTGEALSDSVDDCELTVACDAACRSLLTEKRCVVFAIGGDILTAFIIRRSTDHRIIGGQEGTEDFTVYGDSYFAGTDRGTVRPTLGFDAPLFGPSRAFSFASPEYDETALFTDFAVEITPTLDAGGYLVYSFWIELPSGIPAIPGGSVSWIGPVDDDRQASQGYVYLLHDHEFDDPFFLRAFQGADNQMLTFADGFNIPTTTNLESTTQGFTTAAEYYLRGAAGTHRFASKVTNVDPTTGLDPGFGEGTSVDGNPMGTIGLWFHTTAAGELLDKAFQTTDGWKMLAYPDVPPGMTVGQVIRIILAENAADGILTTLTTTATDFLDSKGNALDIIEVIMTQVGDSLAKLLKEWSQLYCDSRILYSDPPVLEVFRLGEAGVDSGVSWPFNAASADLSCLVDLSVERDDSDIDCLTVDWEGGQVRVPSSGGTSMGLLKTNAKTRLAAIDLGTKVLAWQAAPEQINVTVSPTSTSIPGRDCLLGDIVHFGDGLGGTLHERLVGWGMSKDGDNISWSVTVKDQRVDAFEALNRLIQQQANGTLGGTASSQPTPPPVRFAPQASTKKVQLQPLKNADGAWPIGVGAPEYVEQSCNMYSAKVHLDPVSASDVVLDLLVDGVTIIGGPQTVPAGATGYPIPVAPFGAVTTHYLTPANPITLNLISIDTDVDHMTVDPQTVA